MNFKNYIKAGTLCVASLSITACLEVEEDNSEVVQAINAQTEALENQNTNIQSNAVTLYTTVLKANSLEAVESVEARLKVGPIWQDSIVFDGADVTLEGVPPDSDFELVISSPDNSFMSRTFYGRTRSASGEQVFQALGNIEVYQPSTVQFKVVDSEESSIEGLVFKAYSHLGSGMTEEFYAHTSNYNGETETYSLTLPSESFRRVYVDLDVDNDGEDDFRSITLNSNYWNGYVSSAVLTPDLVWEMAASDQTGGTEEPTFQEVELRINLLDENLNSVPGAVFTIDDEINASVSSSYDENSQQYVLQANLDRSTTVLLPAFEADDVQYVSANLDLRESRELENGFQISTSTNYNDYHSSVIDGTLMLTMEARRGVQNSNIEVVTKSRSVDAPEYEGKFFFSNPVAIDESSVVLYQKDTLNIIRGNDSDADSVFPGYTLVQSVDQSLPVSATLSLSSTLLTLFPEVSLSEGYEYEYKLEDVRDAANGSTLSFRDYNSEGAISFQAGSTEFDIDGVVAANANYWSNGSVIIPANSAGEPTTYKSYRNDVCVYLPPSVLSLSHLTLYNSAIEVDGVSQTTSSTYSIVNNGSLDSRKVYVLNTAYNEEIVSTNSRYTLVEGTPLTEGVWYRHCTYVDLEDDHAESSNKVTFDYHYETQEGERFSGTITLPVL